MGPLKDTSSRKQRQPAVSMCYNSLPLLHTPRTGRQRARRNKISRSALEGMGERSDVLSGLVKHLELLLKPLGLGKIQNMFCQALFSLNF